MALKTVRPVFLLFSFLLFGSSVWGGPLVKKGEIQVRSHLRTGFFTDLDDTIILGTTTGVHSMEMNEKLVYHRQLTPDRVEAMDVSMHFKLIGTDSGFVYYDSFQRLVNHGSLNSDSIPLYVHKMDGAIRWLKMAHPPTRFLAATTHQLGIRAALVGQELLMEKDYQTSINAASLSADGKLASVATDEGIVELFNIDSSELIHRWNLSEIEDNHILAVSSMEFTPSENRLILGGNDGSLTLLDTHDFSVIWSTVVEPAKITQLEWSQENQVIFALNTNGFVQSIDIESGAVLKSYHPRSGKSRHLDYSANTGRMMTVNDDETISIWNAGSESPSEHFDARHATVRTGIIAQSGNHKKLAIRGAGNYVQIWDFPSLKFDVEVRGDTRRVDGFNIGQRDISGPHWSLNSPRSSFSHEGHRILLMHPDPLLWPAATGFQPNAQRRGVFDTNTGELIYFSDLPSISEVDMNHPLLTDLSEDGDKVLALSDGVYEINLNSPDLIAGKPLSLSPVNASYGSAKYLSEHKVVIPSHQSVTILNTLEDLQFIIPFKGRNGRIVFSRDHHYALSSPISIRDDGLMELWDLNTGESRLLFGLDYHDSTRISHIQFLENNSNKIIMIARMGATIPKDQGELLLIDLEEEKILRQIIHEDFNSAFRRGAGKWYIKNGHIWDLEEGIIVASIPSEMQSQNLAFANDNRHMFHTEANKIEIYEISGEPELPELSIVPEPDTGQLWITWPIWEWLDMALQQSSFLDENAQWTTVEDGIFGDYLVDPSVSKRAFFRLILKKDVR